MGARAVIRLVKAELRGRRLRSMSLFVVVVILAAAAIVTGSQAQSTAEDTWNATFEEANGAHVTLFGTTAEFAGPLDDERVAEATHSYRALGDRDVFVGGEAVGEVTVRRVAPSDLPSIGKPLVREGRWVRAGSSDEIVVDRALALTEGIDIGDEIAVGKAGARIALTVVGRAVDLVDCFYPDCEPAPTWVDPAAFARLEATDSFDMVMMRLHDGALAERFVLDVAGAVGTIDWIDTRDDAVGSSELFSAFLQMFGVFVMIAAALVVAGSMAARALARRRDTGVLKAVGCTPRQIAAAILAAHVSAAAVGTFIGWIIGSTLGGKVELQLARTLGGAGPTFETASLVTALVVVLTIVVVAVTVPAWRSGRVPTVAALATVPSRASRRISGAALVRSARVGPIAVTGVRDVLARPARSVLTGLALAVAIVAALVAIGVDRTIDGVLADPALVGDPEEVRVYALSDDEAAASAIRETVTTDTGVESWFVERRVQVGVDDQQVLAIAMSGDVDRAGFVVREGRMFDGPGEAIAGFGFLDRTGLGVGDRFVADVAGTPLDLTIVGWYGEGEDAGNVIRLDASDIAPSTLASAEGWVSVNTTGGASPSTVAASLQDAVEGVGRVIVMETEPEAELQVFLGAFAAVAGLVLLVAAANLASTMSVAIRERTHDLGVLRAVGITPRQTVAVVVSGAIAVALVAVLVGVPVASLTGHWLNAAVGRMIGTGAGIGSDPTVVQIALVVIGALAVTGVVAAGASRRPASAQVADLVRYE